MTIATARRSPSPIRQAELGAIPVTGPWKVEVIAVSRTPSNEHSAGRVKAVKAAAKMWSKQLIDLGGRNTLLHYKDLRAGTLDLSSCNPEARSDLFEGKGVRLSRLVSTADLPDAGRRCRTIRSKARENLEERGLSTLYIAQGLATWKTDPGATTVPSAPVFLRQATLSPIGAMEADFELKLDDEWEANPTLIHTLKSVFKVEVDPESLVDLLDQNGSPDKAFQALRKSATGIAGFAINDRTVLGNFTYVKQPMVQDLENAIDLMIESDVVAALAGDRDAITALRTKTLDVEYDEPDHTPPATEFLVLDADSSQHYVLNAALRGAHLVVQGPPGTGKSQTIANLIASLSGHGKSVLFVAEKRAAIEAVVSRLENVGLRHLVLDLHGGGSNRKKMAQELAAVYQERAKVQAVNRRNEDAALEKLRDKLNSHTEMLHRSRDPWGTSVFELQSRIVGLQDDIRIQYRLSSKHLQFLTDDALNAVKEALAEWISLGGPAVEHKLSPWAQAAENIQTSADAQAALAATRALYQQTLPESTRKLDKVIKTCGLQRPETVEAWAEVLGLLDRVNAIETAAESTIWTFDLHALLSNLQPAAESVLRRATASLFDAAYRNAKRKLREVLRHPLAVPELHSLVSEAVTVLDLWYSARLDQGLPRLPKNLDGTAGAYRQLTYELAALGAYFGSSTFSDTDTDETEEKLEALLEDSETLFKLPAIHQSAEIIDRAGFAKVRQLVSIRSLGIAEAEQMVEYVFCISALEEIALKDKEVHSFNGTRHSQTVAEFTDADKKHVRHGAARVKRAVAEALVRVLNRNPDGDAVIQHEIRKQRRHKTLRELALITPDVLLGLKPCWAMSPLAVSQLLDARKMFDVVIFDEASQVPPADAIPAIMRASQVIVAGDSKQLPPTAFFASTTLDDQSNEGEEATSDTLTEGMESILDAMANIVTAGSVALKWHYRSRDERLIAFSNAQTSLYNWQMVTFPGAASGDALRHVYVPWKPSNAPNDESSAAEVRRVVELVAEHSRTNPQWSLGVIAMGIKHAERIQEALRQARTKDRVLDDFFDKQTTEPVFVKNLERVQGDEREAIILSIGYGKGADGKMLYRFGPINQQGGERRLNVAITRARSQMTLVSTFLPTDLDPSKLRSEGARLLGRYLTYAASEGRDLGPVQSERAELNPFEVDIRDRLVAAGIPLEPQLGVSGYFIDFAARHPDRPGEYVLAIEADGARYHSSPTARERDRLRQSHLENLGWTFHRIWSTDWFRDREGEVDKAYAAWQKACSASNQRREDGNRRHSPKPDDDISIGPISSIETTRPIPQRQGKSPRFKSGSPITDYDDRKLLEIVKWIDSDGYLRSKSELFNEVFTHMGFKRKGDRIVNRLHEVIERYLKTQGR